MTFLKGQNYRDGEQISGLGGLAGGGERDVAATVKRQHEGPHSGREFCILPPRDANIRLVTILHGSFARYYLWGN